MTFPISNIWALYLIDILHQEITCRSNAERVEDLSLILNLLSDDLALDHILEILRPIDLRMYFGAAVMTVVVRN